MRARRMLPLAVLAVACLAPGTAHAGPYYVRGNFYCHAGENGVGGPDNCWGWDAGNEMFDDGLHGDGFASDGVYGAYVACDQPAGRLEWKIATTDWTEAYPSSPFDVFANAVLFTTGPGDVIHFTLDTRFLPGEWQPFLNAVACDHAVPPGTVLELMGSAPEMGAWVTPVSLDHVGPRWQRLLTIAAPGNYEFKIRAAGTWDVAAFGYDYNNTQGRNAFCETTVPFTDVLIQFDEEMGRIRAIELGPTPTLVSPWGALKARYR